MLVVSSTRVQFEADPRLTMVRIVRRGRNPLIGSVHRALLALGLVVSSYQARADSSELSESIVIERGDGGEIDEVLREKARALVMEAAAGSG